MRQSWDASAEVVNSTREADARARRLKDVIYSAYLLGGTFFVVGVCVGLLGGGVRRGDVVGLVIAVSLGSSGLLYMIFAFFLRRRRYWAWVASVVMTVLLLVFVLFLTIWLVVRIPMWRHQEMAMFVAVPLVGLGSWVTALGLILKYLRDALPAVREKEAGAQMGFAVIPVARVAEGGESDEPR